MSAKTRNWTFTLNNYTEDVTPVCLPPGFKYLAFSEETGSKNGTPHLQGFCVRTNSATLASMKKWMPGAHFEIMRGSFLQNEVYCSKQSELIEFGTRPMSQTDKGDAEKERWRRIQSLTLSGDWATLKEEEPQVAVVHLQKLEKFKARFQDKLNDSDELRNYWIYGPPGTGKSYTPRQWCRENGHGLYVKDQNLWWCNYRQQTHVLIDDFNPEWIGKHRLKVWSDYYEFPAQIKGGGMSIRPKTLFVTSNYSIEQVFPPEKDRNLYEAIKRRFITVKKFAKWAPGCPSDPFADTEANAFDILMANKPKKVKEVSKERRVADDTADHNTDPVGCYNRDHPLYPPPAKLKKRSLIN